MLSTFWLVWQLERGIKNVAPLVSLCGFVPCRQSFNAAGCSSISNAAGLSESIVLFSVLHSVMDMNEITCFPNSRNFATLFTQLSYIFSLCTSICLGVAFASDALPKLCSSNTLFWIFMKWKPWTKITMRFGFWYF